MVQVTDKKLHPGDVGAPPLRFRALGTDLLGGVNRAMPYAILSDSPQLSWTAADRTCSETYLMLARDVVAFANQAIGLEKPWPDAPFLMRWKRKYPGNPDMILSRMHARPAEPRPADPCLTDPGIGFDTDAGYDKYSRHMVVTLEYSTSDVIEPGFGEGIRDQPQTFTEVKWTSSAEFLNVAQQNTFFIGTNPNNDDHGGFQYRASSPDPNWRDNDNILTIVPLTQARLDTAKTNTTFEIAHSQIIGIREWTVIWRHVYAIPNAAIRNAKGKVNSTIMPLFDSAYPETVLFTGETVTEEPMRSPTGRRLYTIEYKFLEKQIRIEELNPVQVGGGEQSILLKILGWNHFWRAAKDAKSGAWERLVIDKNADVTTNFYDQSPYKLYDFLKLFQPPTHGFTPEPGSLAALSARQARSNLERGTAHANPMM